MSDTEQRLTRLEKAVGAMGINIHEYDSAEQAEAWVKEQEAASAAAIKQAEEAEEAAAKVRAAAELEQAEAVNRAAADDLKDKKAAVAAAKKGGN